MIRIILSRSDVILLLYAEALDRKKLVNSRALFVGAQKQKKQQKKTRIARHNERIKCTRLVCVYIYLHFVLILFTIKAR